MREDEKRKVIVVGQSDNIMELKNKLAEISNKSTDEINIICIDSVTEFEQHIPKPISESEPKVYRLIPRASLYCDSPKINKIKGHMRPYKFHR
jgi:hypothetical protein